MNAPSRSAYAQALEPCIGILRFRKGPEDIPASNALLLAAIGGAVLLRALLSLLPWPEPMGNPAVLIALELAICLAGIHFALRSAGHAGRFTQTVTAIFGCQVVMAPALLAASWLRVTYFERPGMGGLAQVLYLGLEVWLLAVTVRILRSATEWPVFTCLMLALGIQLLTLLAALTLYPAAAEGAAAPA